MSLKSGGAAGAESVRELVGIEKLPLDELVGRYVTGKEDKMKLVLSNAVAGVLFDRCYPVLKGMVPSTPAERTLAFVLVTVVFSEEEYWRTMHPQHIEAVMRAAVATLQDPDQTGQINFYACLLLLQYYCYRTIVPRELAARYGADIKECLIKVAVGGYCALIETAGERARAQSRMTDDDSVDSTLMSNIIKQQFVYEEKNENPVLHALMKNGHVFLTMLFIAYVGYLKERYEFIAGAVAFMCYMEYDRRTAAAETYGPNQQRVLLSSSLYFTEPMRKKLLRPAGPAAAPTPVGPAHRQVGAGSPQED